jgi:hypothetical protein
MTRARVASLMSAWLFKTLDTVVMDTPNCPAIRFMVGLTAMGSFSAKVA